MSPRHTHDTALLISCGASEEHEIPVRIEYSYTPGCPEQGPSYASGGQPAEGPEVEILGIVLLNSPKYPNTMAPWPVVQMLSNDPELLNELAEAAVEKEQDDRDNAAEARREDALLKAYEKGDEW